MDRAGNPDQLFAFHKLNEQGQRRAQAIAKAYDNLLMELHRQVGVGSLSREYSIAKTKLEESCFFAKKAMALQLHNQVIEDEEEKLQKEDDSKREAAGG